MQHWKVSVPTQILFWDMIFHVHFTSPLGKRQTVGVFGCILISEHGLRTEEDAKFCVSTKIRVLPPILKCTRALV